MKRIFVSCLFAAFVCIAAVSLHVPAALAAPDPVFKVNTERIETTTVEVSYVGADAAIISESTVAGVSGTPGYNNAPRSSCSASLIVGGRGHTNSRALAVPWCRVLN